MLLQAIDFYMKMIQKRSEVGQAFGVKKVLSFSVHFFTKLASNGYDGVKRWTRSVSRCSGDCCLQNDNQLLAPYYLLQVDIFTKDLLLFPANVDGNHWALCVVDIAKEAVTLYDSYYVTGNIHLVRNCPMSVSAAC